MSENQSGGRMRRKSIGPIYLDSNLYAKLERLAASQERTEIQQVQWILRQALNELPDEADPEQPAQPS